jgi:hypothetical protein
VLFEASFGAAAISSSTVGGKPSCLVLNPSIVVGLVQQNEKIPLNIARQVFH